MITPTAPAHDFSAILSNGTTANDPAMNSSTNSTAATTRESRRANKPRFKSGQLMFGLGLIAIGVTAFVVSATGASISTTLSAVVLIEVGVVFYLVRRNRKLLNAMIAAATPVETLTGDAAGPDPELVQAAMAELDEIDVTERP